MRLNKKLFIPFFVIATVLFTVVFLSITHKKQNTQNNNFSSTESIQDASNKILQTEANFKKLPIYTYILEGKWNEIQNFLENTDNKKLFSWTLNKISEEFIHAGNISKNISTLNFSKYLWNKFNETQNQSLKNVYIQNISKLAKVFPKDIEPLQSEITKAYYNNKENSNLKIMLLETALLFGNNKSVNVFSDAINSKQANLMIVAIRSVKNFSKNKYIEEQLVKLTTNSNVNVQATAYKILGIHKNKNIEKNIPKLIASKNAHLVEAGIFVIKELNLTSKHRNILMSNIDTMDYFNKIKAQRLLDDNQ